MDYENFKLEIELGNAAMKSPDDVARALRRIADRLEAGAEGGKVMDSNGNSVGKWGFDE